ncbi:hypothetical protein BATDEDRAFT_27295 [Batrachochytrium dendrobatidis JAM81]|uniref:Uncharacterized protein n=1 Tax=Batrachochytrium dendrobatidis (strain JAM81 / FGSC 10211) TaxID=684364 RepID=F4PAE5_BATDJ|nr:uncharacterized protein BATDEDRAFT_27295 [Batrachochytrium dendrobatidis JAM81]EGF77528.1 hypothetical protein BATDEDRAFT_27295 [Batrachochytrium dendrobatidis JAM81]|eukprot:XP_006681639.1 hypothetical protein BATDEDRAFT_27295 [Batrachochytrium dendrobatidis JAM81]
MTAVLRTYKSKYAIMIVNGLIENNFISNLSINNQQLCKILLANITVSGWKYGTDSNCCQSILSFNTARLTLTSCRGLIISKEKRNPDQIRLECQQQLTVCCYIKTRQYRPTQYNTVSSVINSDTLVSPVPYTMSHIWIHMDTNATIKNQLSFTSPNCQPTIVLMDQRTNAKTPAHQTVYWT